MKKLLWLVPVIGVTPLAVISCSGAEETKPVVEKPVVGVDDSGGIDDGTGSDGTSTDSGSTDKLTDTGTGSSNKPVGEEPTKPTTKTSNLNDIIDMVSLQVKSKHWATDLSNKLNIAKQEDRISKLKELLDLTITDSTELSNISVEPVIYSTTSNTTKWTSNIDELGGKLTAQIKLKRGDEVSKIKEVQIVNLYSVAMLTDKTKLKYGKTSKASEFSVSDVLVAKIPLASTVYTLKDKTSEELKKYVELNTNFAKINSTKGTIAFTPIAATATDSKYDPSVILGQIAVNVSLTVTKSGGVKDTNNVGGDKIYVSGFETAKNTIFKFFKDVQDAQPTSLNTKTLIKPKIADDTEYVANLIWDQKYEKDSKTVDNTAKSPDSFDKSTWNENLLKIIDWSYFFDGTFKYDEDVVKTTSSSTESRTNKTWNATDLYKNQWYRDLNIYTIEFTDVKYAGKGVTTGKSAYEYYTIKFKVKLKGVNGSPSGVVDPEFTFVVQTAPLVTKQNS